MLFAISAVLIGALVRRDYLPLSLTLWGVGSMLWADANPMLWFLAPIAVGYLSRDVFTRLSEHPRRDDRHPRAE